MAEQALVAEFVGKKKPMKGVVSVFVVFTKTTNQSESGHKLSSSAPQVENGSVPSKQACQLITRHKNMVSPGTSLLDELVSRRRKKKKKGDESV